MDNEHEKHIRQLQHRLCLFSSELMRWQRQPRSSAARRGEEECRAAIETLQYCITLLEKEAESCNGRT